MVLLVCAALSSLLHAQVPSVADGGVLNAASFAQGQAVTQGSLVSIFGSNLASRLAQADSIPLSTSLADVTVTFNGIPAPILFVSPDPSGQINAQVPWETMGGGVGSGTATVVVRRGNVSSEPRQIPIAPVSPGIFTTQFGVGPAIAINGDGTLAAPENSIPGLRTRPARIGEVIVVLATGLGQVDPPGRTANASVDALRRTMATPTVLIGGREATVHFSGLAPEFVGVNQLNVGIPQGVQPGNAVPIQLRMGSITTSDRVTIAIAGN
jgi:uncharacterized protein (TIGR03437 family)